MKHYIVNGKPQSGKDTFVDEIVQLMRKDGMQADKISSVGIIKEAAYLLRWDELKTIKEGNFFLTLRIYQL